MIILIFFILYAQYFKLTNDYKGHKFHCFFLSSIYFSSFMNKIVQRICKPCVSPKLTFSSVAVTLAVFIGLARLSLSTRSFLANHPCFFNNSHSIFHFQFLGVLINVLLRSVSNHSCRHGII